MSEIPEVFAIFEQKLAHVLSFTLVAQPNNVKKAVEELLIYFSSIVERARIAESRIAELEALAEKLVDEGCVVAERFSARGGSESDLEGWENVLDEYRDLCPQLPDGDR